MKQIPLEHAVRILGEARWVLWGVTLLHVDFSQWEIRFREPGAKKPRLVALLSRNKTVKCDGEFLHLKASFSEGVMDAMDIRLTPLFERNLEKEAYP